MREKIKKIILKIVELLLHISNKLELKSDYGNFFHSLSPTKDAQNAEPYLDSIKWALKNRKEIKNIAISGAYGSGKSSVIQTFINKNTNKDYKFLNISLATFKELKHNENDDEETNGKNTLRLIELSILQQLFYHEKDKKIPDSRFKKITSYKTRNLILFTIGFIVLLISALYLIAPAFLSKFTFFSLPTNLIKPAHIFASLITLLGVFFIVFKSSRTFKTITIKKLNINNAEIEIENGISKSILNNHIDEILYFFEVTDYNVVFLEDLDRFEQTEVFTKLREINLLINSSQKVKNDVVFIYAIKDDMFTDKERTKFFDFMIPIIPVINSSNSNEILSEIVKQNNYNIAIDLLDDISMFIDDMRLLYNVMNEYYIYSQKLDSKLDQNKLLSMILYKNIYPNDFTLLDKNQGFLFKAIQQKQVYIKKQINKINTEIDKVKTSILDSEKTQLSAIKDLRILYINKIIEQITINKSQPFYRFWANNSPISISDYLDDNFFTNLFTGKIEYLYGTTNGYRANFSFNFKDIESSVNDSYSYKEQEEQIINKTNSNKLKKQITELENKKNESRKSSLKDLIENEEIILEESDEKQEKLVNILLRNGYIDENYLDYITIFYEGSLAKTDYQFLINVKTKESSDFDYKLLKVENLVEKISLFDFEKEYILNFDIVEFLLKSTNYNAKKERLFKQLSNQSKNSIDFIDQFLNITANIELFIENICQYWSNIWSYIKDESLFEDKKKENYFIYILKYANLNDIREIISTHTNYLNGRIDIFEFIDNQEKVKRIIEENGLKFYKLNQLLPQYLTEYIYNGSYYAINDELLIFYLKLYNKFDLDSFLSSNYSCILNSSLESMIKYINQNIDVYINNVYLNLISNTKEPLSNYLILLNNEKIDIVLKEKLIIQVETKIEDINAIEEKSLWNIILEKSKLNPTWENILECYTNEENKINKSLTSFINNSENANKLSKTRMPLEIKGENVYGNLCRKLIYENEISEESFEFVTKSIPWSYSDLEFEHFSDENRISILINNSKITPSIKNYQSLKDYSDGLNIVLLERFPNKFIEIIDELILDSNDLEMILQSSILTNETKNILLGHCAIDVINSSNKILKILSDFIVKGVEFSELGLTTIKKILLNSGITSENRIRIFNDNKSNFDNSFIRSFLESLNDNYNEIADMSKKATLINNSFNKLFLDNLIAINFISSVSKTKKGLRVNHKRK